MKTLIHGAVSWAPFGTLTALVALLAGCESTPLNTAGSGAPVETRSTTGSTAAGGTGATAGAAPQSNVTTVDLATRSGAAGTAAMAMPTQRVVYFDFDSFAIKDDYKAMLDGYARVLAGNRSKRMAVEGHTDERGGREYNLALGQKRAAAVVQSLTLLGAGDNQLEAVSFGKERPAVQGNDESAWAKNRRAELKDR